MSLTEIIKTKNATIRVIIFCIAIVSINIFIEIYVVPVLQEYYSIKSAAFQFLEISCRLLLVLPSLYYLIVKPFLAINRRLLFAKNLAEEKAEFLAVASHELRTPLSSIINIAALMKETGLNNQQSKYIDLLGKVSDSLYELINNVLFLSTKHPEIVKAEFLPLLVIDSSVEIFRLIAGERVIKRDACFSDSVEYFNESTPQPFVHGSIHQFKQVITNIINNSIKHTDSKKGQIVITVQKTATNIVLEFKDNGNGIPTNMLRKVFTKFQKGDSIKDGVGLGLAICKDIIESMNGQISAQSVPNHSTTITISLPYTLRIPNSPTIGQAVEQVRIDGIKILMAEDDEICAILATKILESAGGQVKKVQNGKEAVFEALAHASDYHVIIMDIRMPVMDGIEASKLINASDTQCRIPIIALSANAFDEDVIRSKEAGCVMHLSKPCKKEILLAAILKVIDERKKE